MAMAGLGSVCINHPGVEAVGRCKQCGKPFCNACKVSGPTGFFCSAECKQKHEVFVQRAQQLDSKKGGLGFGRLMRRGIGLIMVILIIAIALGVFGTIFQVPVLSPMVRSVRSMIGI